MTPPTSSTADLKVTDQPGGAPRFRRFIADELMPWVRNRYRVTDEAAIMGESLAGLFVVDTLLKKPGLFDTYVALDPSLWWNNRKAMREANARLGDAFLQGKRMILVSAGGESNAADIAAFLRDVKNAAHPGLQPVHIARPDTTHATIYRTVAGDMLRLAFAP